MCVCVGGGGRHAFLVDLTGSMTPHIQAVAQQVDIGVCVCVWGGGGDRHAFLVDPTGSMMPHIQAVGHKCVCVYVCVGGEGCTNTGHDTQVDIGVRGGGGGEQGSHASIRAMA